MPHAVALYLHCLTQAGWRQATPSIPVHQGAEKESDYATEQRAVRHRTCESGSAPSELFAHGFQENAKHVECLGALRESARHHHGDDDPAVEEAGLTLGVSRRVHWITLHRKPNEDLLGQHWIPLREH